jgi:hypothetical protein
MKSSARYSDSGVSLFVRAACLRGVAPVRVRRAGALTADSQGSE